jgi:hypothetical protein
MKTTLTYSKQACADDHGREDCNAVTKTFN